MVAVADFYNKSVTIKRLTHSDDNYGGTDDTWATHLTEYKCRIYSPTGFSSISDIGEIPEMAYKALGEIEDIQNGDKLIDGTEEYLIKRVYELQDKSTVRILKFNMDKIK